MSPLTIGSFVKARANMPELSKLKKATDGFETAFVKQMVSELRKSSQNEFGDVPGNGVYDDMTNEAVANQISAGGKFGISNTMFSQLSKLFLSETKEPNNGTQL